MAKDKLSDYDGVTASNNTDIGGVSIAEGMLPSNVNNSMRELTKQLGAFADGTDGVDVLKLQDDTDTNSIKLQAPASVTADTTFTMPDGDGSADQVLKTDGSGQLGWADRHANPSLIINGAMTVSQRGTSFTNLANGQYCLDRFHISKITGGAVDIKQTDDAPTASQAGYLLTKCLHADVTTADSSVAASDMYTIRQRIEYKNIAYVGFGQSGTRYVTASFWVKSTKTGTFCCYIKADNHTRAYTKEYTVSASDTWEYKALTFPVDTSSTSVWDGTSTDTGAELGWTLYGGTDYHITADTWTTTSNNYAPCTSNQVNALDSASNDFKITGVKLEVGSTATDFVHRSYGEELALCQRYYQKTHQGPAGSPSGSMFSSSGIQGQTTTGMINGPYVYPIQMRTNPTVSYYDFNGTASKVTRYNPNSANYHNETGGPTQIQPNLLLLNSTSGSAASQVAAHMELDAEL